jgi:L-aspartate semialdehyde sulfurtransferase ferredoxin
MAIKRMVFTFPPHVVGEPIAYYLVKDFDIKINIIKGKISPEEEGTLVVELEAEEGLLEKGMDYIRGLGIIVKPLEKEIHWSEERCTHCTACVPVCPREAFVLERPSMKISFESSRCVVCELCLNVCPFQALSMGV